MRYDDIAVLRSELHKDKLKALDLVAFNKNDLLKFRNFGKKSLTELEELVEGKNLAFGMDVSKYKLESE